MAQNSVKEKVALITGAGSGIGRALARELAARGYRLALCGRTPDTLEQTRTLCGLEESRILTLTADVSQAEECQVFVERAIQHFGRADVLINNAGISMRALFKDLDPQVIEKVMRVNFWGTVFCTHFALPHLLQNKGSVVGISSIAGIKGLPARSGYSASKFAMEGFLEALRIENLKTGLHVLTVRPGFTTSNIRNTALTADGSIQGESPRDESRMMSAETCARLIVRALESRRTQLTLTTQGKLLRWVNFLMPRLADRLVYNSLAKEKNSPLS
jgi:short-subunit dehydrogenase